MSGTLLPVHYLAEQLAQDAVALGGGQLGINATAFDRWWIRVAQVCGPASGLRMLFDVIAMPLFAMLGFTASRAEFMRDRCHAVLETSRGTPLALVLLGWSARPTALWRELAQAARDIGASWCFVLAPPFLSLIDTRGFAGRRSLDLHLPSMTSDPGFSVLMAIAHADAFDSAADVGSHGVVPRIDRLIAHATAYQARVRADLQLGVSDARVVLADALAGRSMHASMPRGVTSAVRAAPDEEALTLIYRILFLLFAESRHLVPAGDQTYDGAYAIRTLCREALRPAPRFSLREALAATTRLSRSGCRGAGFTMNPFNGHLFAREAAPALESRRPRRRANGASQLEAAVSRALIALGSREGRAGREEISYSDLGVEQLGTVYEHLLDQEYPSTPATSRPNPRRPTPRGHSNQRKHTGTFYTPQPLAEFVVRRTLAPLVAGASPEAILSLRIVDPAMGSGAFLVAACRYLSRAYEQALIDHDGLSPEDLDDAEQARIRRLIAERCLSGVDRNPVAVQLARLSLWLTTLAGGKPLSFLDHRLRTGDSLVGAAPGDLSRVPRGRGPARELPLFEAHMLEHAARQFVGPFTELISRSDDTIADVRAKEAMWRQLTSPRSPRHPWHVASSLWCARWFWPDAHGKPPSPQELRALLDALLRKDQTLSAARVAERVRQVLTTAAARRFFHWPLEFPDVFYGATGAVKERPGFDAVIGNPPWEMWRRDPSTRHTPPDTREAAAENAVSPVSDAEPAQLTRFIRDSGLYPSCDRGHLNLYQPFLERSLSLTRSGGRVGLVLPWGLASDDGAERLRRKLFDETSLETIVGLDNASGLFPIHRGTRFLALVASPGNRTRETRARFGVKTATELDELAGHDDIAAHDLFPVRLTPARVARIGGPTWRIPDLRRAEAAALLERLSTRFPSVGADISGACRFGRELNATEAKPHFGPTGLPVIEGKHLTPFGVQTASGILIDPLVARRVLPTARFDVPRLGYRDIAGVSNRLSLIAAIVPAGVVTTHTILCLRTPLADVRQQFLCAMFNSYALNYIVRMLMGGHLTTSLIEGLPVPAWRDDVEDRAIVRLARALGGTVGTAPEDVSDHHAELQARVARRYELTSQEIELVLSGFPLVPVTDRQRVSRAFERFGVG
ncbi:MAG: N-6 DNA methylase [Vicinamibacterales bacterium]